MEEKKSKEPRLPNEEVPANLRFEAVALPCAEALHRRAVHLLRRREGARDLVQETYLRAYRNFAGFRDGTNCQAWLLAILYSVFINQYRKRQRQPKTISLDQADGLLHQMLAASSQAGDFAETTGAGAEWQEREVRWALANLPESFRRTVVLVDVQGMTYKEAAASMSCPVGTLRSRLFRARRLLFFELHSYAEERGIIQHRYDSDEASIRRQRGVVPLPRPSGVPHFA